MSDEQYAALQAGTPIWDYHLRADPKPARRIKATAREWQELRAEKGTAPCRICERPGPTTLHHLVPKSLRGDDVADNLCGICGSGTTGCHGLVEAHDPWACSLLGQRLTVAERAYVVGKKGAAFLERYYGLREAA